MTDDRPYIEIQFTGAKLTQYTSNTLIGTNIVIDYGDGNTVNYTGDYSHTYSANGTYTIRIYGITSLGDACFNGCSGLTSIIIPNSVTSLGDACLGSCGSLTSVIIPVSVTSIGGNCFNFCRGLTNMQLNWTSSTDIITYNSTWISYANSGLVFTIPYGTTSLYSAKGFPTERLVERSPSVSSHVLFTDVIRLLLNGSEVESIVVDDIDGGVLYQKPHTNITLTAINNTISYGETVTLNGTVDGVNSGTVKLYQNDTLIDTLNISNNGSFTKTFNNLNAGTYTYKAVYDGDNTHYDGQSNGVIITVNKATPVLTLNSDKSVIHYNETVTVTGTTTVNGTIKIYQTGEATPLSSIESNNGTFTYTFTNQGQDNIQIYANIESTSNYNQASSNIVTLTYNSKYSTNLTIEVPALVYSDTFDVTGLLTDDNNNPVSNASVKLYRDGDLLEATETTDNNGEVTFHRNAPTSITHYDFQLQYDGDTYHNSSNSSIITRIVNRETSVLNLSSPLNNSQYTDNELITVTGNLSDNDATPLINKNIIINDGEKEHFYINNNYINGSNLDTNLTYVVAHVGKRGDIILEQITENMPYGYDGETYHIYSSESSNNEIAEATNNFIFIESIEASTDIQFNYLGEISETNTEFTVFGNILSTFTTDSNGDFTGTINSNLLDTGRNEVCFNFIEETYYTGATQTITVNIQEETTSTPSSLSLSSNKTILSYLHNESATLTATVLDENDNPCADELVVFNVDGTITNAQTNSNGIATTTYNSNNDGEIYVTATCSNVQDSITINDIYYYNSGAELSKMSDFNVSGRWSAKNTSAGNVTCTTDETEWLNITASGISNYGHIPITPLIGLNQPFKLSCIIKDANRDDRGSGGTYVSSYSGFYACRSTGGYGILLQWSPFRIPRSDKGSYDNWQILSYPDSPSNGTYKYEVTFNGSSITHKLYYLDGNVYKTASISCGDLNNANYSVEYGISYDYNRNFDIKDIKAELL